MPFRYYSFAERIVVRDVSFIFIISVVLPRVLNILRVKPIAVF